MANRRIAWLLAVLMAVPAAYSVPAPRSGRNTGTWAIVCLFKKRGEQQAPRTLRRNSAEITRATGSLGYNPPQIRLIIWPSSYQRPPTLIPSA